MKNRWMVFAALPLVAATAVAAGMQGSKNGGLKRVVDAHEDQGTFDAAAWKKKLAAKDLKERERAFEELSELARRDSEAKEAVESWAQGDDSDLAWTSRLLKRELDRRGGMFRHLPGGRGPMVFSAPHGGGQGFGAFDWEDFSRRFDDLDSMFGDLREEWGDMLRHLPSTSGGSKSSSRSLQLRTGPDGVTCEVTETVDGKEQTRTYQAKDMEELLEAHPELRDSLGGATFRWTPGSGGGLFITPRGQRGLPRAEPPGGLRPESGVDSSGNPRTDRLGIMCSEVGEDRAAELGLDEGVGLVVHEVVPGSIASLLGLREGDVIAEVNGTEIRSSEDVRKALADRASDAEVEVVVAGDGSRRTLTWKPRTSDKKSSEKDSGGKKGSRDL